MNKKLIASAAASVAFGGLMLATPVLVTPALAQDAAIPKQTVDKALHDRLPEPSARTAR